MNDPKHPSNSSSGPDSGEESSRPEEDKESVPADERPEEPTSESSGQTPEEDRKVPTDPSEGPPAEEKSSGKEEAAAPPPKPPKKSTASEEEPDEEESSWARRERELGGRMTFLEHLDELRRRILFAVAGILVAFVVAWIFREPIYNFVAAPIYQVLGGQKLNVFKPTDSFTIYLKVSFICSVFLSSPFILVQIWLFVAPGLYRNEKRFAIPFLLSSTVLFVLGGAFAYYVVLPPALRFLILEFGESFNPMISAIEYFDFALLIIVGLGVMFQLPILVAFLSIFGLITPRFLWKNFRYAFLIITIIAAVLSPTTDPFNLFLWSGPMVILYVISIGVSWIFKKRRARRQKREGWSD